MCLATQLYILAVGGADRARVVAEEVIAATEATGVASSIVLSFFGKGEAFAETDPAAAREPRRRGIQHSEPLWYGNACRSGQQLRAR